MEPDYARLIQDLAKQHDAVRQSSANDLVAQARPKQLLLYRRLCKLYHKLPMEGKYPYVPRQGYCKRCKFQQPHFAFKCSTCDMKLLFTDVPPDAIDLLPTLPRFKPGVFAKKQKGRQKSTERRQRRNLRARDSVNLESLQAQQPQNQPKNSNRRSLCCSL